MHLKPVVLIVDNSVAVTGAIKAILGSINNLTDHFSFVFVLPEGSAAVQEISRYGYSVYTLPFVEISKRPVMLLRFFPSLFINSIKLKRITRQEKVRILHLNDFYNLTGIGAKLFGFSGALVTHVRFMPQRFGILGPVWSALNRTFSDRIICVSEAVRAFFSENHPKISVIHDPLPVVENFPSFGAKPLRDTIDLVYVANFIHGKGQNFALQAFTEAYKQNPLLRLKFIGGDMGLEKNKEYKKELIRQVHKLGLTGIVSFAPYSEEVELEVKQADIALNFSESESFSLTCLEALYFNTPLIATDCGGPAELFEDEKSGILVPNKNVARMTKAILRLAADPELRSKLAAESRPYVEQKFGVQNTSEKLGQLYAQVLEAS